MEQFVVESELTEMEKVRDFLKESLTGLKLTEEEYFAIELSLLEICTNIVRYAYPEDKDKIFLKTWFTQEKVFLEIRDNGIPFDPSQVQKPDLDRIIQSEEIGGFGILLSRNFMDGFEYKRENDQNVLTMFKNISP